MGKAKLLPKISTPGMPGFLLWMRRDNPRAYSKMTGDIPAVAAFEEQLTQSVDPSVIKTLGGIVLDKPDLVPSEDNWYLDPATVLGDFSDLLSSIGDTVSNAAGAVGSWIGQNAGSLVAAGASVAVLAKQSQLANTQLQLAQARQPPAQTALAYTPAGQPYYVPVQRTGAAGNYSYAPASSSFLNSAPLGVPIWVWGSGAAAGLVLLLALRR